MPDLFIDRELHRQITIAQRADDAIRKSLQNDFTDIADVRTSLHKTKIDALDEVLDLMFPSVGYDDIE